MDCPAGPGGTGHTLACTTLARGENELWVAAQLGHKDVGLVRRHYGKKWIAVKDAPIPAENDWSKIA